MSRTASCATLGVSSRSQDHADAGALLKRIPPGCACARFAPGRALAIHDGELSVRMRGGAHVLRAGDVLKVHRGCPHLMWHRQGQRLRLSLSLVVGFA
jgi:uncharacterized cupin superfamily protein